MLGRVVQLWCRLITKADHFGAIEIHFEHAGALHRFAIHLALRLWPALEEQPGGLDRIGVAHAQGCLSRMIARQPQHDISNATAELGDGFIACD